METPVAILKREPICIPDTPAELLNEVHETHWNLAEQARQVLGYKPLLQSLEAPKTAKPGVEARVADIFGRLGIVPFTPESVTAYQRQGRTRARTWKQKWPNVCLSTFEGTFLLGLAALVSTGLALIFAKPPAWFVWFVTNGWITTGASFAALIVTTIISGNIGDWEWRSVPINEYQQPVPEAALKMAIALKRGWPTAVIEIESLSLGSRTRDPFLVFKIEEQGFKKRYHVGVWAEPNFQAEFR